MTTTDLSLFGNRERAEAVELLTAYSNGQTTKLADDYFQNDGVTIMFNQMSGYVFLTNSDYQVLMFNYGELDLFITTPYNGCEGFMDDLIEDYENMHHEDQEYLRRMMSEEQKEQITELEEAE